MKKTICCILSAALAAAFLSGCAARPNEETVQAAIENGTLTLDDALEKDYVTAEWVSEYQQKRAVPASDKFTANQIGAFTTEDAHGDEFTFTPGDMPVLFLFVNPENGESLAGIQMAEAAYEDIQSAGGDAVLVLMGKTVPDALAGCPIPTIFYGEDIKNQLGSNQDMIDGNDFSASWSMKGSFITAWYRTLEEKDLPQTATDLLDTFSQSATETKNYAGMVGG